jgi:lysophospholipase L1-like esterase
MGGVKIEPGSRLLFIGDSVTDCGRARPAGEGSREALGHGYVADVDAALAALRPNPSIRVTNTGVSADTVRNLALRWESDVIALKPDWLSVMIGINDVWRQFTGRHSEAVLPDEYVRVYDGLLARTLPRLKGLVLMSPYLVDDRMTEPMRRRMDEYGALVKGLAAKHGALFVDTQKAFDAALAARPYTELAGDRVHPTAAGHAVLAGAFLLAIGISPPIRP